MTFRGLVVMALLLTVHPAAADGDSGKLTKIKERELDDVRQRISELKRSMDRNVEDRDRLTAELQALEIQVSERRIALRELERRQLNTRDKKNTLLADLALREQHLEAEGSALSRQVKAAYMSGSEEKLRLLLSQRDPATLGRMMVYYRYLNDYRADNISAIIDEIRELDAIRGRIADEEAKLEKLARARYAELTELNTALEGRSDVLASLKQKIQTAGAEVERLARQEQDLTRLIAELTSILSDYPISSEQPFSEHRGKLTWPVAGTLLHDYGQPRVGGNIKWNGVVLAAPRGREVRAVYHGRVAFADWLAGMGLLVIVDHGDDYMTLYGYNESILKNPGDWVAPGDVIATVGDSGGQPRAGLYFELRRGTQPINVHNWVTRRPGG
ncbi:MAG: peptidoglycan DD-metalloendopeptidase family protein [Gammaproteobacteria bacterium]|nr:peptidoglycan DD-metalloendopeptidase family protein [Gammaproteobacteria bacterium]